METTAAIIRAPGQEFSIEQVTLEEPRANEILVRIAGVGLCHTDLLARDGGIPVALPAVFGHEGAGEVVAVGSAVTKLEVGDHVVLSFGACHQCASCHRGDGPYCDSTWALNYTGSRPDGSKAIHRGEEAISSHFFSQSSFAGFALASEDNAVRIDKDLPLELMGPLGCGIQTGAGAIMNTLACEPGSSLLVTGGGSLGLSAVLAAVVRGCTTIIVSEPHEVRRQLALELGATHTIDPIKEDLAAAVRTIVPAGVDYAFDATGLVPVINGAAASLGKRGVLAVAGVPTAPDSMASVPILPLIALGQSIRGTVEGDSQPQTFIPQLISLYREGRFPFDRLIKAYPLSRINEAVADHHSAKCLKAVLIPER